jgi:hypothetical protein
MPHRTVSPVLLPLAVPAAATALHAGGALDFGERILASEPPLSPTCAFSGLSFREPSGTSTLDPIAWDTCTEGHTTLLSKSSMLSGPCFTLWILAVRAHFKLSS